LPIELPITDPILQFTALVTVALIVQLTVERMHLPGLIGLLIIGMVLGPGGLHVLPRGEVMELLGAVGLVYVMFVVGLEIDLDIFKTHRRETLAFGLAAFVLSLVPAALAGLLLGFSFQAAVLLGTLLSSHTLLAYPVIERLGIVHRTAVVAAIGGTLVTDTLALMLLAVVIQAEQGGVAGRFLPLVLLGVISAASWWLVPRMAGFLLDYRRATRAEKALFVLVVLLVLSSLAELIGTHEILGAFLAGLCLNRVRERREVLLEHVEFVGRMLFIPFFFVSTGMLLDLEVFTGQARVWMLAGLLLGLVIFGKLSASWLIGRVYGYSTFERLLMTGLTMPQAAATLAVTLLARDAGIFEEEVVDAVIIVVFLTCLAAPLVTSWVGKRVRAAEQQSGERGAAGGPS
jgi:Kef-type K+ transport system membrane component KefB